MQWPNVLIIAACVVPALAGVASGALPQDSPNASPPPAALAPPLGVMPIEDPRIAGGFGETRSNHIHAGLDLSTGGVVGKVVRAPLAGSIERLRTSGIGYGRSLYLRADDGRLLVFGHLDAFAPRIALYADSVQRSSGQFEQDLWPTGGRFRVRLGETIAWTGESGGGGPHLHFEIRHGDFALNPVRAGFAYGAFAPRIESVVLEPLDAASWVDGSAGPVELPLAGPPREVVVEGRVRAVVRTRAGWPGADTPAWSTSVTWRDKRIEARLDSISWAGEMSQLDEMIDRGRIAGREGFILFAPGGWRPRFFRTTAPTLEPAGIIAIIPNDPPEPLEVVARDEQGTSASSVFMLRGPRPEERGPRATGDARPGALAWNFASLPGGYLRVTVSGAPAGLSDPTIAFDAQAEEAARASRRGDTLAAVLRVGALPRDGAVVASGTLGSGDRWTRRFAGLLWPAGADVLLQPAEFASLSVPRAAVYEPGVLVTSVAAPAGGGGLSPLSPVLRVAPARFPLARPAPIRWRLPAGAGPEHVAIYRRMPGGDWDWLGGTPDSLGAGLTTTTAFLGEFALLRDDTPPVVQILPPHAARAAPYSRWSLGAAVRESGSGVDSRASAFVVDGRRVPSEWDPEANQLRWRPLQLPARGTHEYEVIVTDHAGNEARKRGRFVIS